MIRPYSKNPHPPRSLEWHYRDFRDRFIDYRNNLTLPVNVQKSVYLGLAPSFTHRLVRNSTHRSTLGFILEVSKKGRFGILSEQIPGKIKHLIDAQNYNTPQKKLETVHKLQKDILTTKRSLNRQRIAIQKRIKIKAGSSEELVSAKSTFGAYADNAIKVLESRLAFASGVLRELEQKYLTEEHK